MDFKQTGMLRHCHFAEPERTNRFYVLSPFPPLSLSLSHVKEKGGNVSRQASKHATTSNVNRRRVQQIYIKRLSTSITKDIG